MTAEWRQAFYWLAKEAKVPHLECATFEVRPLQAKGILADPVTGCLPAFKAAVDGIIDCGVLTDDSSKYIRSVLFMATEKGPDSLTIVIREAE